ncbi:hypothetical protein LTR64_004403 [Lithohypha guttulata]|uniref:ER membrane protein complex subunit 3 n=1 Tax=Lithohypha guttulata TaxID=1690604 RepID=A0AAN7T2Q4_9EURO|nr:hypothetical protein LTR51_006301 [Lithohypha guttulata]KAK5088507.1 hypothetical protein LTR05_002727 [Lithohypha guttulata]
MAVYGEEQVIQRDPALFYWILLPITVVMILTGVLRHYATILLQTPPKPPAHPTEARERQALQQSAILRSNLPASGLSNAGFSIRKDYLIDNYKKGTFLKNGPESRGQAQPNPMSDPAAMEGMMGMMKGNMAMMIPQTLIMSWINAFFAGFVILKLPFPLTIRFKQMLQAGVMTRDLDSVFIFILGNDNAASQVTQQMAMSNPMGAGGGGGPMQPGQDPDKMFLAEAENLEVIEWWSVLDGVEERILASG